MTEFIPLAGDKKFAEDKSIIGGLARLNDTPIVIIGHEKETIQSQEFNIILGWQDPKVIEKQ